MSAVSRIGPDYIAPPLAADDAADRLTALAHAMGGTGKSLNQSFAWSPFQPDPHPRRGQRRL